MLKRFGFLILTNILIISVLTVVTRLLGLEPYMTAYGINYQSLFIMCLVWGMGGSFISLFLSKFMAKTFYGVKIVEPNGQYAGLVSRVHQYSRQAGLSKMPEVGVFESPDPNAFATGATKNSSLVAFSSGLLNRMGQDEVDGVIAHEVAHIANGDMVTMTLLQGIMNAFVMFFARIIAFAINNAIKDEDGRGGLGYIGQTMVIIALQIVFGLLASIIVAYFSRYREYRADEGGAKLAGKSKMIAALRKLQQTYDLAPVDRNDSLAAMKISAKGAMKLYATHPPLADRIAALENKQIS